MQIRMKGPYLEVLVLWIEDLKKASLNYSLFDKEGTKTVVIEGKNSQRSIFLNLFIWYGIWFVLQCINILTNVFLDHAYSTITMVCLGALFGCKRSNSIVGYLLSALVTISILCVLRLLCFGLVRLLKRRDSSAGEHLNGSLEMQSQNIQHGQ